MHFYLYLHSAKAKVAQLVEHDLAKVGVASSNLVFRSNPFHKKGFIVKRFVSRISRDKHLLGPDVSGWQTRPDLNRGAPKGAA